VQAAGSTRLNAAAPRLLQQQRGGPQAGNNMPALHNLPSQSGGLGPAAQLGQRGACQLLLQGGAVQRHGMQALGMGTYQLVPRAAGQGQGAQLGQLGVGMSAVAQGGSGGVEQGQGAGGLLPWRPTFDPTDM
jgi:hypothetical protein